MSNTDFKQCCKCKEELPLENFGNKRSTKDGLQKVCKNCRKSLKVAPEIQNTDTKRCCKCKEELQLEILVKIEVQTMVFKESAKNVIVLIVY